MLSVMNIMFDLSVDFMKLTKMCQYYIHKNCFIYMYSLTENITLT